MASRPTGSQPRNPYSQLTPIRHAEMFFGRENSLEHLCNSIIDGQSIAIIGPRRIGKSSLLTCCRSPEIQKRVGYDLSDLLLILIDLEEHLQRTPDDFFAFVCEQLLQQSQGKFVLDLPSGTGGDQFSQLLYQIKSQGSHPVLLLDEFDSIIRNPQFNPDFFSFLRAQANAGRVSYVTASLATLDQICHTGIVGSPFFNIFSHHNLGPLTEDAALELITIPSNAANNPFTEQEIQFVLRLAGRHPFYIQRTCYFLFQQKLRSESKLNLKRITGQIYDELLPHFTYAWSHLEPERQEQLKREAVRQDSPQRNFPELSESSLFRKFVRDKTKILASELTMESLRSALDKLDDFKFLGESPLGNLNIIYNHEHTAILTPLERGMRVYKLLQDTLARLQPSGPQNNTTLGSQTYTILNSCYFKKDRRSNKQLASFLGMSERDFYRKKDDAINTLLSMIVKMESSYTADLDI